MLQCCKPIEEITTDKFVLLRFDQDTVSFDTVFAGQLSISRKLKVYNTSDNAISISSIRLAGMENSFFSLIINGLQTNQTNNLFLRGKDSLFILTNVTLDQNDKTLPFLVADSIIFITNANEQKVYLESYGQNANYYNGDTIKSNTTWDSTKAQFIKKTVFVAKEATLTIEKGTKLYFVKGAGMKIAGSLQVKGDSGKIVAFQGPRLDADYRNLPGLWQGIEFLPTAKNNMIDYAEIKNAVNGIVIGDTNNLLNGNLKITNTVIKNMSGYGLQAHNVNLTAWNCVVYNCAYNGFLLSGKGDYRCYNNTFAFTFSDFTRFGAALEIKDGERSLQLVNNIIWGSGYTGTELVFSKQSTDIFNKNLVRHADKLLTADTSNFWNTNPKFVSENGGNLNFSLDSLSPAVGKAVKLIEFTNDIKGKNRGDKWDIGAYQFSK
ncbi:MAG: hypothetical protein ACKVOU_14910 [Cytophagales bacterium]